MNWVDKIRNAPVTGHLSTADQVAQDIDALKAHVAHLLAQTDVMPKSILCGQGLHLIHNKDGSLFLEIDHGVMYSIKNASAKLENVPVGFDPTKLQTQALSNALTVLKNSGFSVSSAGYGYLNLSNYNSNQNYHELWQKA